MIRLAVVLAAGRGARLAGSDLPKPLTPVCGLTLLERTLLSLRAEGVTRAVVVVGYRADEVKAALRGRRDLGLEVVFADNPDWELSNGVSVLAARSAVDGPFLLAMADHVFDRAIVRALQAAGAPDRGLALAVDRRVHAVFDLEDATKVRTAGDAIAAIGKDLGDYDAVDTGLFACTPALFEALAEVRAERGDCSLSEGVARLAREGRARAIDVGGAFWQDVDTPATLREAERRLLESLRKPADGIVARHLNRRVSLAITRRLCRSPVRPNHVTVFTFAVGCAAAALVALGGYAFSVAGAFLYQCKSILDGVDGELARLKFQGTRLGEWLDTLGDDLSNLVFYGGVAAGAHRSSGDPVFLYLGAAGIAMAALCSALMYHWIWTRHRSGDLLRFRWFFEGEAPSPASSWLSRLKYLGKQDFFALFFFGLALAGVLHVALYLVCVAGATLLALLSVQYARSGADERVERRIPTR